MGLCVWLHPRADAGNKGLEKLKGYGSIANELGRPGPVEVRGDFLATIPLELR